MDRLKIALVGYGRMGHEVEAVAEEVGHEIVARIDDGSTLGAESLAGADVAVEFTGPGAAVSNIRKLASTGTDIVVGTTGWYDRLDEVRTAVDDAGIGLIYAPNFSLGVQLFFRMARRLGELVEAMEQYDLHVHEIHHRHKTDHPSGTGRRLAEILVDVVGRKRDWVEGPQESPPDPDLLEVTSSRVGEVPGTHLVGVEGPDDRIELRHEARGRRGFARGAVEAASWIRGRKGVHTLDDMLGDRFEG